MIDFWESYARNKCAEGVSTGRLAQYDRQMKQYLCPDLSNMELCRISAEDINRVLRQMSRTCPTGTLSSVRALLYKIFHLAILQGLRSDNPVEKAIKIHTCRQRAYGYSPQEFGVLLKAFRESDLPGALTFQLLTGLSRAEVFGLRAGGVDLRMDTIAIDQFYVMNEMKIPMILQESNNYRSRQITVPGCAMDVLTEELILREKRRHHAGDAWNNRYDLVFTDADGGPISDNTFLRAIRNVRKKCNYRGSRSLQDHFALMAIQLGASAVDLHEYLGHKSFYPLDRYMRSVKNSADEDLLDIYYRESVAFDLAGKESAPEWQEE